LRPVNKIRSGFQDFFQSAINLEDLASFFF